MIAVAERFAPISLTELLSEAELLTRVDRKYLVPTAVAREVLERVDARSRVLEIDGARDFAYDSVYFDTPDHLAYRLTAQRRRHRFKLRTRSYVDTGGTFLELKTKDGRGRTVKRRRPHPPELRAELDAAAREHVAARLPELQQKAELVDELVPALVSRYRRTTLLLPEGSRATIDTALEWESLMHAQTAQARDELELPHLAIIESKSPGGPNSLDRMLWQRGYRPSGISKFGTGTAALDPQLPHNKWARTLRRLSSAETQRSQRALGSASEGRIAA